MKIKTFATEFVENIPEKLEMEEGVLYVSNTYEIAVHKCFCGCGIETVTPLSRNSWELIIAGPLVSLTPSIGNQQLPCRSHYYITRNRVEWYK